jgi:hypothetical protein
VEFGNSLKMENKYSVKQISNILQGQNYKTMKINKLIILIICCVMFSCNKDTEVSFEFVKSIDIKENFDYPPKLIHKKEQLIHIFTQKHKPLYKLKGYINYEAFDFENFDYLLVFNNELLKIEVAEDECGYLSKTPVKAIYSEGNKENSYIYVYKIFDKNKYRDLCP